MRFLRLHATRREGLCNIRYRHIMDRCLQACRFPRDYCVDESGAWGNLCLHRFVTRRSRDAAPHSRFIARLPHPVPYYRLFLGNALSPPQTFLKILEICCAILTNTMYNDMTIYYLTTQLPVIHAF